MDLMKVYVLILLGVNLLLSRTDGERLCSCYTFSKNQWSWPNARDSCKFNNKTLVVMESEQEWQFITNEIQNKTGNRYDEWHMGLKKNPQTLKWNWINGKSITIDKWQKQGNNPDPADSYGIIHKEYPKGFKGSFSTIKSDLQRGWICEEETATCRGICFVHPALNTTRPTETSTGTNAVTTQSRTSTEQDVTAVSGSSTIASTPTRAKSTDEAKSSTKVIMDDSSSSSPSIMVVAASLGAVFFVALIIFIAVIVLRRKKRQGKDEESAPPKKSASKSRGKDQLGESQYASVNPAEAAKLLRSANITPDMSETRREPPPVNCEYAVVNKANKKRKEADLVYAQLAEFDHETDSAKPPKPPNYEPTVYADVEEMPPELPGREDPDCSQPTYANLETTGV